MSTTPEPRFEVPPEYAEVYERAYRRAYEQGMGVPASPDEPARPTGGGKRIAVPRQRAASPAEQPPRRGGARRAGTPTRPRPERGPDLTIHLVPEASAEPAVATTTARRRRHGHRGVPRTGSTWVPLLVLVALALMLIAGAFVLGRATADGAGPLRLDAAVVRTDRR